MGLKRIPLVNKEVLEQTAGITGLGWTASLLGFLSSVIGYGNYLLSRVVTDPQSLLYLAGAFFVATLGLDRLAKSAPDE